jgi:3-mercaptopyruvate sulfurtransferase SseA
MIPLSLLSALLLSGEPDAGILHKSKGVTTVEKGKSPEKKIEIPPKQFYQQALEDPEPETATAEEVLKWLGEKSAVLIDLRSTDSYARDHIVNAVNLPATEMTDEMVAKLLPKKDARVVVYCDFQLFPTRRIAVTTLGVPALRRLGYTDVRLLESLWMRKDRQDPNAKKHGGLTFTKSP